MTKIVHRIINEPLVIVGVIAAAVDSYDGEPSWQGIGAAVVTALARFVVTGPLTSKGD